MKTNTIIEKAILNEEFLTQKKTEIKNSVDAILAKSDDEVMDFFSDYIAWNGVFGGCVAKLAGDWHLAAYTRQPDRLKPLFNKVGHKIASNIFASAEDEFADENCQTDERIAHKDMAWFFLNKLFEFYGRDIKTRRVTKHAESAIRSTMNGYWSNSASKSYELMSEALGFHLGSEKIASFEFDYLYKGLVETRPELIEFLKEQLLVPGITAADWLFVHGSVEEDHYQYAVTSAAFIYDFIEGNDKCLVTTKDLIYDLKMGFEDFSRLQTRYFDYYVNDIVLA